MITRWGLGGRTAAMALAVATIGSSAALAQDGPLRLRGPAALHVRTAMRPLTVHRRGYRAAPGPVLADGGYYTYEGPGIIRRWNDPNLDSFGGWRLGGDNFYGDGRGDTITRGNATLGQIAGYGPARGGYGGPHFDSVGGFHNGPGPDAKEDADYASGSVSQPDYEGVVPRYPGVRARVAALNAGVPARIASTPVAYRAPVVQEERERYAQPDDVFPGFDLGADAF